MALCAALAVITGAILLRVGRGAYADLQGAQGQQVRGRCCCTTFQQGARRAVLSCDDAALGGARARAGVPLCGHAETQPYGAAREQPPLQHPYPA